LAACSSGSSGSGASADPNKPLVVAASPTPHAQILKFVQDISANPKNLKFKELEAAQLPRALDDVDAAVINGNYALGANLKPSTDALVLEKAEGNPYANILAVKKGHESDPRVQKLAELLHSAEVKKYIDDTFQGAVIPAF
ncbi:MAG: hypothetical protein LBV78_00560, partial [Kitasatospora sp.]|nr:hypothetical protein [Kitasatospora sp.]